MRRWIAGAAAGLGLLLGAPGAMAQSVPTKWTGSRITTPTTWPDGSPAITALLVHSSGRNLGASLKVETWFTTPAGLPSACPAPGEAKLTTVVSAASANNAWNSAAAASAPCNGTYPFRIVATLSQPLSPDDKLPLSGSVTIAVPPPEVSGVEASLQGGTVSITWRALSDPPPDFTGYVVQRQTPGGDYTTIATLGPSSTSFTDQSLPPEGGETVYRVLATRNGPNGDVRSAGGGRSKPIDLPVTTTTTAPPTATTDGGATDGGTAGTGGATVGADGGGTSGTGGTGGSGRGGTRSPGTPARGSTGIGLPSPRIGSSSQSGLLLSPDEGFDEEIDYGELPGGDEAADPSLEIFEDEAGRGLTVPIGIGAVLFAWGLHLFFLARAARPATMAVPVDDGLGGGYDDGYDDVYSSPPLGSTSYGGYGTASGSSYGSGSRYGYSSYSSYDDTDDGW